MYEDRHIMLVVKRAGFLSESAEDAALRKAAVGGSMAGGLMPGGAAPIAPAAPAGGSGGPTVQSHAMKVGLARAPLAAPGKEDAEGLGGDAFAYPVITHRLDRNTGGLMALAKTAGALECLIDYGRAGMLTKGYKCVVLGCPNPPSGTLVGWLFKDARKSEVYVYRERRAHASRIETAYETEGYAVGADLSVLRVTITSGRTHQIRAHLAAAGHPILGDGRYGEYARNKALKADGQMLSSTSLTFGAGLGGALGYLSGKAFVSDVDYMGLIMGKA